VDVWGEPVGITLRLEKSRFQCFNYLLTPPSLIFNGNLRLLQRKMVRDLKVEFKTGLKDKHKVEAVMMRN